MTGESDGDREVGYRLKGDKVGGDASLAGKTGDWLGGSVGTGVGFGVGGGVVGGGVVGGGVGDEVGFRLRLGRGVGGFVGILDGRAVGLNVAMPPALLPSSTTRTDAYPGATSYRIASTNTVSVTPVPLQLATL